MPKRIDIRGAIYVLIALLTPIGAQGNAPITRATIIGAIVSALVAWKAYLSQGPVRADTTTDTVVLSTPGVSSQRTTDATD
jgi:hypothetical protein